MNTPMKLCSQHLKYGIAVLGMIASTAWGTNHELTVNTTSTSNFTNTDCKNNQTCSLKSFGIYTEQYQMKVTGADGETTSYGTKMVASYETDTNSNLEKYGVGQFIQGCQYFSKREKGVVTRLPVVVRQYRGKWIPYFHPKMVIDGFTVDPLSWGDDSKKPRHFNYFTKFPDREFLAEDYHGVKPSQGTQLYVEDHPGVATYYPDTDHAYNISLKFKTCIYRSADVPKKVAANNLNFAKPIHCFEWASSYVYNFEQEKFETLPEIDPYCFSQKTKAH
jgi:hypothetical protein